MPRAQDRDVLVLSELARRRGVDGVARASYPSLARATGLGEGAVRRAIADLSSSAAIETVATATATTSSAYRLSTKGEELMASAPTPDTPSDTRRDTPPRQGVDTLSRHPVGTLSTPVRGEGGSSSSLSKEHDDDDERTAKPTVLVLEERFYLALEALGERLARALVGGDTPPVPVAATPVAAPPPDTRRDTRPATPVATPVADTPSPRRVAELAAPPPEEQAVTTRVVEAIAKLYRGGMVYHEEIVTPARLTLCAKDMVLALTSKRVSSPGTWWEKSLLSSTWSFDPATSKPWPDVVVAARGRGPLPEPFAWLTELMPRAAARPGDDPLAGLDPMTCDRLRDEARALVEAEWLSAGAASSRGDLHRKHLRTLAARERAKQPA